MIVPTLKAQQVQAEELVGPYQSANVSALSQGGGVAAGIESIGGALSDYAVTAKKQADQVSEFEATADANDFADGLNQDLINKDGPALMQAYEGLLPAYDKAVSERASRITSDDAREAFMQNARSIRGTLAARATVTAKPKFDKMQVAALQRIDGSFSKSVTLAVANGAVRSGQTPSLPASVVGMEGTTGTEAPDVLDERGIAPFFSAAHDAHVKWADAHPGELDADRDTWIATADRVWREGAHAAVMRGLLTRGDDRTARRYFEAHKADFSEDDILQIQADVERASQVGEIQRDTASIWGKQDAAAPWSERRKEFSEAASKAEYPAETMKALDALADGQMKREHETRNETHNALKQALATGTPLATVVQSVEFGSLSEEPDLQDSLVTYGNDVVSGKYAVTDWAEYGRLQMLRDEDPQAFANENLDANNSLNESDRKYMKAGQKEISGLSSGGLTYDAVVSGAARALYPDSFTSSDEKLAGLRGQFAKDVNDAVIAFQQATGKKATPEDVQKITDAYLGKQVFRVPYKVFGLFETGSMTTEEKAVSDMLPASVLDDAITALTKAKIPITTENLAEFARHWHAGG